MREFVATTKTGSGSLPARPVGGANAGEAPCLGLHHGFECVVPQGALLL